MATSGEHVRSVAFDRAAEYYDATRGLTPEALERTVAVLSEELAGRGRCLEIGVGTGRIGLPLHRSGVTMTGLDLSRPMMSKLIEKAAGDPFPLVQGTATRLPFHDHVFGAGLIVHVLHLIPNWQDALDELVRVIRPGGAIVISIGDDKDEKPSMWEDMTTRFRKEAGLPPHFLGFRRTDEIHGAMAALGAKQRELASVPERRSRSPREIADLLESGVFSFTWGAETSVLQAAAERLKTWAAERYGPLDEPHEDTFDIPWRVYDLP
ncbi:MAG TPA: methyltransferase domain-containing protein [Actinomycetota bacterium]|jgi:ubiquinone/menaquinone biosynthesis C-methylase UbiE|nr:methyltransferase domain-containing protein [Actinomycetota bacterium]